MISSNCAVKMELRKRKISQQELAEELGISRSYLNKKLNRNGTDFSRGEIEAIKNKFNIGVEKFFSSSNSGIEKDKKVGKKEKKKSDK